jgi:hypothetical protein
LGLVVRVVWPEQTTEQVVRNLCLQLLRRLAAVQDRLLLPQDFRVGLVVVLRVVHLLGRERLTKGMLVEPEQPPPPPMEQVEEVALEVWVLTEQLLLEEMADLEFLQILPALA